MLFVFLFTGDAERLGKEHVHPEIVEVKEAGLVLDLCVCLCVLYAVGGWWDVIIPQCPVFILFFSASYRDTTQGCNTIH